MAKIDIISGFLGAGKTTLIKKLIKEAFAGEKLVIIENEFGEIGIDGGFLKESGIQITEMNSGCICCSLVGDFGNALKEVLEKYTPDRVIIEPSGVGKLSDVIKAVKKIGDDVEINSTTTVVDVKKCKMYIKNYGEFYNNQIESAGTVVLSRTQDVSDEKLDKALELIKDLNSEASIITTPWDDINGKNILEAMEKVNTLEKELMEAAKFDYEKDQKEAEEHKKMHEHGHHHHHHDHDEEHECHHHHDHDEEHECHHHHDHDEEHECHHHHDHDEEHECHHHHDHDEEHECHHDHDHEHGECCCHHHEGDGHHGHHHHADDIFESIGIETAKKFTEEELQGILDKITETDDFGEILRAKGIVAATEGEWFHFDLVPGETELRRGAADYTGRICVIGANVKKDEVKKLFA
ncbi:MAG: GTP-binding protein [Lachnospiraceae bacterium]|nr:GTP-binding protein [Lachnospiraceae bacterium]